MGPGAAELAVPGSRSVLGVQNRIHDALNISTDDARQRHVAIGDAEQQVVVVVGHLWG